MIPSNNSYICKIRKSNNIHIRRAVINNMTNAKVRLRNNNNEKITNNTTRAIYILLECERKIGSIGKYMSHTIIDSNATPIEPTIIRLFFRLLFRKIILNQIKAMGIYKYGIERSNISSFPIQIFICSPHAHIYRQFK